MAAAPPPLRPICSSGKFLKGMKTVVGGVELHLQVFCASVINLFPQHMRARMHTRECVCAGEVNSVIAGNGHTISTGMPRDTRVCSRCEARNNGRLNSCKNRNIGGKKLRCLGDEHSQHISRIQGCGSCAERLWLGRSAQKAAPTRTC